MAVDGPLHELGLGKLSGAVIQRSLHQRPGMVLVFRLVDGVGVRQALWDGEQGCCEGGLEAHLFESILLFCCGFGDGRGGCNKTYRTGRVERESPVAYNGIEFAKSRRGRAASMSAISGDPRIRLRVFQVQVYG